MSHSPIGIRKVDSSVEWAHNGNGVRGISGLHGMGKPRFGSVRMDSSTRHPVRVAMVLRAFVGRLQNIVDGILQTMPPSGTNPQTTACLSLEGLGMFFERMLQ